MSQTPNPFNTKNLSRATLVAAALAVIGIALFFALWIFLGSQGVDQLARLLLSMCIPPALIAAVLGSYLLLVQPRSKD